MKLHDVQLTKTDTCLTYVLKRLGLEENLCTYDTILEYFEDYQYKRVKEFNIGDVLLWDRDIEWVWLSWKIEGSSIIWKNVPVGFHFGIVETDTSTFTDCTRHVRPPHPSLRLRNIDDIRKKPDWVLRYNGDKNEI